MSIELIRALLPKGGITVALVTAYFDESGTQSGANVLCVAGYLFSDSGGAAFDREWSEMLRMGKIEYFHMADAQQLTGPHKGRTHDQTDRSARRAIRAIKKHALRAFVASIEPKHFPLVPPSSGFWINSPYTLLCYHALMAVRLWAAKNSYDGDVQYVFEAGAPHERDAMQFMSSMLRHDDLRARYKSIGHSFVDKRKFSQLQAADMLAWHWHKHYPRHVAKKKARGDFEELLKVDTHVAHIDEQYLSGLTLRFLQVGDKAPG